MIVDEYTVKRVVDDWEPPTDPHCSNCLHAKVGGPVRDPQVRCAKNQGRIVVPLVKLIRPRRPIQFRPARECPDFESMGPACEGRPRWS